MMTPRHGRAPHAAEEPSVRVSMALGIGVKERALGRTAACGIAARLRTAALAGSAGGAGGAVGAGSPRGGGTTPRGGG